MIPRNAILYKQSDPNDPNAPNIPMTPEETAEFWRVYDEQQAREAEKRAASQPG